MNTAITTANINFSPAQIHAADEIKNWFTEINNDDEAFEQRPIFRLFGYAGTGKTTIIRETVKALEIEDNVIFAAYTGKAALVMQRNGIPARTIHSLIYRPVEPNKKELEELHKQLDEIEADTPETKEAKKALRDLINEKSKLHFVLCDRDKSDLSDASLLVLDECSMVNDEIMNDLLSFKVPMLVLGDPGQLPPIEGSGALIRADPDVTLTEIHRQAEGNPILDFATRARNGIYIPKIHLGSSSHESKNDFRNFRLLDYDQILTGKNKTRQTLNNAVRLLKDLHQPYPQIGDKLICLKNNADVGLYNGLMCEVLEVGDMLDLAIELKIKTELNQELEVKALRAHFESYQDDKALENLRWWDRKDKEEFDFGYAITVHKAQGSQWDNVLLFDDNFFVWDKPQRRKWLYTAITRAVNSITIVS